MSKKSEIVNKKIEQLLTRKGCLIADAKGSLFLVKMAAIKRMGLQLIFR